MISFGIEASGPILKVVAAAFGLCAPVFVGRYLYRAHGIIFGSETHMDIYVLRGKFRVLNGVWGRDVRNLFGTGRATCADYKNLSLLVAIQFCKALNLSGLSFNHFALSGLALWLI
jgi:hypothetical protein